MSNSYTDRRQFLQLMGLTALASTVDVSIAKALAIPANNRTGTIEDVEHIVILMQENRPFDHHFGTLRGVRGFSDPRAVKINLPRQSGSGTTPASVFLQPAGAANVTSGFAVDPSTVGGPADGAPVIPPFRINPQSVDPALKNLGLTYLPGTDHSWKGTHDAWNNGQNDSWASSKGPTAMSYMTRDDIPYHFALADAFTVGDAYFCSVMGPTNPNRCYMWTGCVGNVGYLGNGGTDGLGAGPVTANGLINGAYYIWETFPEVLQESGVSWKIYQDIAGVPFKPDFGDGTSNAFAGNYTDNSVLYFNQYATAAPGTPLFDNGATGTEIIKSLPNASAPAQDWQAWAEQLFSQFRNDVTKGTLPQVSWIVAPAGYTEHSDWPINYGAWYLSQIFDILVSNPDVFSKTVFLINYDEADGSFDHVVPPTPPSTDEQGASTVSIDHEIVTTTDPHGPIGLGTRVPLLAISPWSKGGYVNSEVFDHTSVIQFIEKRFGVTEKNISQWRRAVSGDLTSLFNFATPNHTHTHLPSTKNDQPPAAELAGGDTTTFRPALNDVSVGVPAQEKGVRPARALPYQLDVHAAVNQPRCEVRLTFSNTGFAAAVFHVRSGNATEPVRNYTVEPGKTLNGTWQVASAYQLSVYGPNGFMRYFSGSVGDDATTIDVRSEYKRSAHGAIELTLTNLAATAADVNVLDAYTGHSISRLLDPRERLNRELSLGEFYGWYDVIVTVAGDSTFSYRLAGHVETGRDSVSDPVLGGLVTLKG
jgi:phospholipase C